jgi:hypothetical protein
MLDYEEQIMAILDKLINPGKNGSEDRRRKMPLRDLGPTTWASATFSAAIPSSA